MKPLEAEGPTPRVHILVADNEEAMFHTLTTIIDLAGYEICAVYDGDAAVRLLDILQPELVITDLSARPGKVDLSTLGTPKLPRCRILLFTGGTNLHGLLRQHEASMLPFDLMTRPIRTADLLTRLRDSFCSDRPPLLVPIETDDAPVH